MPFISSLEVAEMRVKIKTMHPECKFSVTMDAYAGVKVAILASPYFEDGEYYQVNHYWLKDTNDEKSKFLQRLLDIIESVKPVCEFDNNPDYGSIPNYYIWITVGKWDKPHVKRVAKNAA